MRVLGLERGTAALLCALMVVHPVAVAAQTTAEAPDIDAARQLFKDGVQLEKEGKFADALAKFEEVALTKTTAQVHFHLGICNEKLGHYGAAIEAYEAAAKQAGIDGTAPDVLSLAPGFAKSLREKLPKLTVTFANDEVPERLAIDGKIVEPSEAKDYPLDPGKHLIVATEGARTAREAIELHDGESAQVRLTFVAKPAKVPIYSDPAERVRLTHGNAEAPESSSTRTLGWVFGGIGLASLGAAGALYYLRSHTLNELDNACANRTCPTSTRETYDKAKTFNTAGAIALGVGAGAVLLGAALIITGKPAEKTPPPVARVVPWAPGSTFGIGLEGAF